MPQFQSVTLIANVQRQPYPVRTEVRIVPDAAAFSLPLRGYAEPRQPVTRDTAWIARLTGHFDSATQAEDFAHHIADRSGIIGGRLVSQAAGCIDEPPPNYQELTHE